MNDDHVPTRTDRIEAAHWARDARAQLDSWLACVERFSHFPAGHGTAASWSEDLDDVIETIGIVKRALRGQHNRGGSTIFAGMAPADHREPDTRAVTQRKGPRSGD